MTAVFVDTSYLIALARPGDQWHDSAVTARGRLAGDVFLVTTQEVLVEFLTAMSNAGPESRKHAAGMVKDILESGAMKVIPQSDQSFLDGLSRYERRSDKRYSLQDCISMNVMDAEGITDVLTSDRDFDQEGFAVLMQPIP